MTTSVGDLYAPSIIDRLTVWVASRVRQPVLAYVAAAAVLAAVMTGIEWLSGAYPVGMVRLAHLEIAAVGPLWLWLIGTFNVAGDRAVTRLRPILALDDAGVEALRLRLTALPFGPTLLLCVISAAASAARTILDPSSLARIGLSTRPLSEGVMVAILIALSFVGITFVLKLLWSAWQVHRLSTHFVRVDLARVNLLYGLAGLTGRMAVSLALSIAAFVAASPQSFAEVYGSISGISAVVVSAIVFVVPLIGVHDQLVLAKTEAIDTAQAQFFALGERLHRVVEADDLPSMDPINKAVGAAEIELRGLRAIPTWPWLPETFRWVVGALMFPIVLFVAQYLLSQMLA